MQIEKMKLADLRPASYNPRIDLEPGMEEFEKLKSSIQEFGFVDPPIFNKRTGNLVGGHQRVAVAQHLAQYDEIEVSVVDLPLKKEKALNVALNKISGKWDEEKLSILLTEIESDVELTGFGTDEINELLESSVDHEENIYTDKIEIPHYQITDEQPSIDELFDNQKTSDLIKEIETHEIPPDVEYFLVYAAFRHLVFDYGKIAEYYAHADKEIQELFERSALVIVDFNNAIADGYVRLNQTLEELRDKDE